MRMKEIGYGKNVVNCNEKGIERRSIHFSLASYTQDFYFYPLIAFSTSRCRVGVNGVSFPIALVLESFSSDAFCS